MLRLVVWLQPPPCCRSQIACRIVPVTSPAASSAHWTDRHILSACWAGYSILPVKYRYLRTFATTSSFYGTLDDISIFVDVLPVFVVRYSFLCIHEWVGAGTKWVVHYLNLALWAICPPFLDICKVHIYSATTNKITRLFQSNLTIEFCSTTWHPCFYTGALLCPQVGVHGISVSAFMRTPNRVWLEA